MNNIEEIYNQALGMQKKGHSKEEVLLKFANFRTELSPLLDINASLFQLPKKQAPEPAMQRKYVFISAKRAWLAWVHISKFAGVSMSVLLLLSAFSITGYAALRSVPGQALFTVKKQAERVQYLLAYNQADKAKIQISIAEQRLNDAQQIFNDPQSNTEQKKAAITELTNQTTSAITEVTNATQKDPKSENNHPLLNSLENINSQQRNLLSKIKPDTQINEVASNALQTVNVDSAKISAIKEHVAIANNEQSLTELTSNPNAISVLGEISQVSDSQITVDKTVFSINLQTVIKDNQGKAVSISTLSPKLKVNVVGIKSSNNLIAQQILVPVDTGLSATDGQVKGDSTLISDKNATTVETTLKRAETSEKREQFKNSSSTGSVIYQDSSSAVGSVIFEDPAPQFSGN